MGVGWDVSRPDRRHAHRRSPRTRGRRSACRGNRSSARSPGRHPTGTSCTVPIRRSGHDRPRHSTRSARARSSGWRSSAQDRRPSCDREPRCRMHRTGWRRSRHPPVSKGLPRLLTSAVRRPTVGACRPYLAIARYRVSIPFFTLEHDNLSGACPPRAPVRLERSSVPGGMHAVACRAACTL